MPLASIGSRFIALIIDVLLLGLVGGALTSVTGPIGPIASVLLGIGYQWYFLTQHDGQTPGKMLLDIRVIKADGSPLTGPDAAIRYVGYTINSLVFFVGWFWALFDNQRRGWHDLFTKTLVVKAK